MTILPRIADGAIAATKHGMQLVVIGPTVNRVVESGIEEPSVMKRHRTPAFLSHCEIKTTEPKNGNARLRRRGQFLNQLISLERRSLIRAARKCHD
jgi:hypothetical protein